MPNEFRYQNSINLSIGLIAAASALMAGSLTAFFSMADKVPHTFAGALLVISCILSLLLCTTSVIFGGRGVSVTMRAAQSKSPTDRYDMGNFNRQAIFGALGVIAVIGMVMLSLAIKGERTAEPMQAVEAREKAFAESSRRLEALESRMAELARQVDRIAQQRKVR